VTGAAHVINANIDWAANGPGWYVFTTTTPDNQSGDRCSGTESGRVVVYNRNDQPVNDVVNITVN
jgi:hypothetical protein